MRRHVPSALVLTFACSVLLPPVAGAQPEDHTRVPLDPGAICAALHDAYTESPVDERITLSVVHAGVSHSETITLRTRPVDGEPLPRVELVLGPLTLWTTRDMLYAVHADDSKVYFSAPIQSGDALGAIHDALPPIPAPNLDFALAGAHGCPDALAYLPGLDWSDAVVNAEARPASARLRGAASSGGATIDLLADLEPPILRTFTIDEKEEGVRIEGEVRRAEPTQHSLGVDVSSRRRVSTVAELAPMQNVLHVGDVLAPVLVHPFGPASPGVANPLVPLRGPGVAIFFTEWDRDAPVVIAAALQAAKPFPDYQVWPVAVLKQPVGSDTSNALLQTAREKLDSHPLYYTTDPGRTIERISPWAGDGIIVLDADQIVRMVERTDNFWIIDEPTLIVTRITAGITAR